MSRRTSAASRLVARAASGSSTSDPASVFSAVIVSISGPGSTAWSTDLMYGICCSSHEALTGSSGQERTTMGVMAVV